MCFSEDEKERLYNRMVALEKRQSWFMGGLAACTFLGLIIVSSISAQLSEISPLITSTAVAESKISNAERSTAMLTESVDRLSNELRDYSRSINSELREQRLRILELERAKRED